MKKLLMVITILLATVIVAQDKAISSAAARGKIGDIIKDPSSMTSVMKQLAASDQASFLADVNAAISKMPGSPEEKTSKFLEVNSAALKGAQKGNLTKLLAEVFATVPPESLTAINESFAAGMFNRASDPSKTYTDEDYTKIAKDVLAAVQDRNATADNSGVRNTFAILMLIRASNGSPADLRDTLVGELRNEETRSLAQNEWISPALGQGQEKTYDPMLGAADAGSQPKLDMVLAVSYVAAGDALAADLASECSLSDASSSITALIGPAFSDPNAMDIADGVDPLSSAAISRLPRTMDPSAKYNPGNNQRGRMTIVPVEESDIYDGQSLWN
ncbi:MAG: hypothetical protein IJQ54_05530 [Kiritimatiellae bacterium]|nr:hypothetical protein [Kiritimatiellia bacterium]